MIGFDRSRVLFSGNEGCKPDIVICATGYRSGLEALVGNLGVLNANGYPMYPMGEVDPAHRGLWFTGFKPIFTGNFDAAGIAARRIAKCIELTVNSAVSDATSPPILEQANAIR